MNIASYNPFTDRTARWRTLASLGLPALYLIFVANLADGAIDEGMTRQVWKLKYNVSAAQMADLEWLGHDSDGDGATNTEEMAAGTNPFSPSTTIRVSNVVLSGGNAQLTFPTELGKRYQAERATSLMTANYSPVGTIMAGTGEPVMISVPHAGTFYYRIRVFDVDTDGDGLADWLEQATGLNPNTPLVNGNPDLSEYNYVSNQLALPSEVNIRTATTFASEDGPTPGAFTVTRTQTLLPLTVNYTISGTATPGVDYTALPGTITFLAGAATPSEPLSVNPLQNIPSTEGSESVTVTLTAPGGDEPPYLVGANASATVIIGETTSPSGTGLTARYYDTLGSAKTYSFTRSNTTSGEAVISHTGSPTVAAGDVVTIQFTSGNMAVAPFNVMNNYKVSAVTPGSSFRVPINGTSLPANGAGNCLVNFPNFNPAPTIHRIDATVDNDWLAGIPNANNVAIGATTNANPTDNWSSRWEGYLQPSSSNNYQFQLDGDDKARVLLDVNQNGTFELPGEQILEHGWDTAGTATPEDGVADDETIGSFKQSAAHALTQGQRYRIRVEMVETTGEARCRFQWRAGTAAYANIAQANVFSQVSAMTYSYTRGGSSPNFTGNVTVTLAGHGYAVGNTVEVSFSTGNLFLPGNGNFHGSYTVTAVAGNTFTFALPSGALPGNGTGSGYVLNRPGSTTTGWYNVVYTNTGFTAPVGRIGINNNGTNDYNNGNYGRGTPDPALIHPDTFHVRWTGQVQPQFSEEYTFVVHADDGVCLRINGEIQEMRAVPATNSAVGTYTYNSGTGDVTVTYSGAVIKPDSFVVGEPVRLDPSTGNLTHGNGSTYNFDGVTGIATVNYSNLVNIIAGGFIEGETIELDPTDGPLSTLALLPYSISNVTATTFDIAIGTGIFDSGAGAINISDNRNVIVTGVSAPGTWPTTFTFHIGSGKYNTGTGNVNVEIINRPLKEWSSMGNERYCRIPMVAGVRYDIQLDYWDNNSTARCRLFWFSPSQPKQIIPKERLYPETVPQAPPAHLAGTETITLVGDQVVIPIAVSNGGQVSISGNPPWLTYANGVLSSNGAIPAGAAGDYQILVTTSNADGTSTSVVNVRVADTGGTIVLEHWNGNYATLADIPTHDPASGSSSLSELAVEDAGDSFGSRIRGYITAPQTGNYYFYIAASNLAELWISNDDDPINAFKRAWVATGSSTAENWTAEPHQKSAWLALEEGKKYYIEILAKALTGADNLAVGWIKPGQTAPSVVPGYVLSEYVPSNAVASSGTLYVATMLSQNGAITNGVGSSTLRLSEDETTAYMRYNFNGLTGPITSQHIHIDPNPGHNDGEIVFDIDTPETPGDGLITNPNDPNFGAYRWTINPIGTYDNPVDIVNAIKSGKAYINLHTAMYPAGEIRGNYTLAVGSRTFTPPPPPPSVWTDDSNTPNGAARFLTQATYGPNIADITALTALPATSSSGEYPPSRYETWIDNQFALSESLNGHLLEEVFRTENASAQGGAWDENLMINAWWFRSIDGPDQLRQRIAFALSEIHVVSAQGPLDNEARGLAHFYDTLVDNAFGNFREILEDTTLTPGMGRYLDMLRNDKPDQTIGRIPNENYAREIKQLFSIGLFRMWPDGTLMLSANDTPIDTYKQPEIIGFAHVFTGWDYGYDGAYRTTMGAAANWTRPMREVPARHYTGTKRLLNNEVLPGMSSLGGQPLDPIATHTANLYNQPAYQQLARQELDYAHDQLFNHPNTGPFICRQLIQRLVSSHPSRDYLYRVVQKFNDNGAGVRGDMKAVIKAILLDYEARHPNVVDDLGYGKQRESLLRVSAAARAFRIAPWQGTYQQTGDQAITVTLNAGEPPHRLENGDNIFLNFTSGSPAPWIGSYTVSNVTTNTFRIAAQGWATGTYSIAQNSSTCRIQMNNHWLQVGHQVYVDFTTGPANGDAGLDTTVYTLSNASAQTGSGASSFFEFQIAPGEVSASARTGNVMIPRFTPGSFTTAASGLPVPNDRRVTMDTNVAHHLNVGDQVQLNFTGGNPQPVDMVVTVERIVDLNTWTFTASGSGTNLSPNQGNNSVYQFPLVSQPLVRSGNVGNRPSTFAMNNTTADLEQAPLYSPTVFNFYLPDYKFPGPLASQGLTTPEFQTTAETTVMRQANYLYNGIFGEGNSNGISSFNNGNHALVLDFFPWYGPATTDGLGAGPSTSLPWTHNQNLSTLIDHMSTLLCAGQLSSTAKTRIKNFIATPITAVTQHATNLCTFTTSVPHNFRVGESVVVSGLTGGTFNVSVNNNATARTIASVPTPTSFTVTGQTCTSNSGVNFTNGHVSVVQYNQGSTSPTNQNRRDRLRALIHLILTSPDFTIQR